MNESSSCAESTHNREYVSLTQNVELFETMKVDTMSIMKDGSRVPRSVYALPQPMKVGIDPATHELASSARVTHIDPETQRAWILYRVPNRTRPVGGWVSLADIRPALNCTITNDIPPEQDDVDMLISGVNSAALDLVDGKLHVKVRSKVQPFEHPKYPYIHGVCHLTKLARGICIYSKAAEQYVAATVAVVDSELEYFLAEYEVDGQPRYKWLSGDKFTPELVAKRD